MSAHFGLDIGSYSIKAVQAERKGKSYKLVGLGEIRTPANILSQSEADKRAIGAVGLEANPKSDPSVTLIREGWFVICLFCVCQLLCFSVAHSFHFVVDILVHLVEGEGEGDTEDIAVFPHAPSLVDEDQQPTVDDVC